MKFTGATDPQAAKLYFMQRLRLYKYNAGKLILTAAALSPSAAWVLIRNGCIKQKLPAPDIDKIVLVRKLTAQETKDLKDGKELF